MTLEHSVSKLMAAVAAILCALTLVMFRAPGPALAQDKVCGGKNLIAEMQLDDPSAAKSLETVAATIPFGAGKFWRVEKDGLAPSYIFGTIHMSDPRVLKLEPKVEAQFNQAQTVALEITEILDPAKMAGMAFTMLQFTTFTGEKSLDGLVNDKQKAIITEQIRANGMPWSVARKLKPWAVLGTISLPACEKARKAQGKPFLDMMLGLKARAKGKDVVALETMESQMIAMNSLPEEATVKALVETALMAEQIDDVFETMTQLYLDGDMGTLMAMMRKLGPDGLAANKEAAGFKEFQSVIIDKRNVSMVKSAEPLLEKGNAFIAVGALHLPGENGILNILAQLGYKVTAP